jgi:hypothetical protein
MVFGDGEMSNNVAQIGIDIGLGPRYGARVDGDMVFPMELTNGNPDQEG